MSLNSIRKDIFSYFQTNWTETAIVFQGQDAGDDLLNGANPWIYLYLLFDKKTSQESLGKNNVKFVRNGTTAIKLYVRKEDGDSVLFDMADSLENLFRNKKINNIQFVSPGTTIFKNPPPGWIGASVSCFFGADTHHDI